MSYKMHQRMSGLIGIWAIDVLLQGYARHFQELRQSDVLKSPGQKTGIEALQKIGDSISYGADIATVTAELTAFAKSKRRLSFDIAAFVPSPDVPESWKERSLEQVIHEQIGTNANWLHSIEGAVRDYMSQYGNILGVVEDIRIQKGISRLTWVLVALTIALALLTLLTASEHIPWLRSQLESITNVF